jgi:hypothetical protein
MAMNSTSRGAGGLRGAGLGRRRRVRRGAPRGPALGRGGEREERDDEREQQAAGRLEGGAARRR